MRQRDPSIKLIGWGDRDAKARAVGAGTAEPRGRAYRPGGDAHDGAESPRRPDTVLKGLRYQKEPERAWEELIELTARVETRVSEMESAIAGQRSKAGIAITEGHLSLSRTTRIRFSYEWLSAVYHARSLNIYQRHGARVKIATAADFQGNRWTVNAVMLQTPRGVSYLMPVGFHRAAVQEVQREAGRGGAVRAGEPGHRGEPDRG